MLTPNAIQQLIMHIFYYSETLWHFFFWNCKLINNHSMFKWPMLKAEKEMIVLKVFYCWLTNCPRRQLSLVGKHLSCEILQNQDLLLKSNEFKCYGFLNFVHTKGWVKKKTDNIFTNQRTKIIQWWQFCDWAPHCQLFQRNHYIWREEVQLRDGIEGLETALK